MYCNAMQMCVILHAASRFLWQCPAVLKLTTWRVSKERKHEDAWGMFVLCWYWSLTNVHLWWTHPNIRVPQLQCKVLIWHNPSRPLRNTNQSASLLCPLSAPQHHLLRVLQWLGCTARQARCHCPGRSANMEMRVQKPRSAPSPELPCDLTMWHSNYCTYTCTIIVCCAWRVTSRCSWNSFFVPKTVPLCHLEETSSRYTAVCKPSSSTPLAFR